MSKEAFSFSDSLKVKDGNDNVIMTVKQPFKCKPWKVGYSGRSRIFYQGEDDDDDSQVAESKEKRCNLLEFFGQDEYEVDVEPNVDCLLVFAILVALDEMEEDKQ